MQKIDINNYKKIHFVGIGGCSMSGLALLFKDKGFYVQGSDRKESSFTKTLTENGIRVFIGHEAENVGDCDLLVYSAAIKPENPERMYAEEHGIMQVERCDALGALSGEYEHVVCISGCHGKTTITSMLALINKCAKMDATVHVGGYVDFLGCGVNIGNHDCFITEACEYVESFLSLTPTTIVLNNIDDDHLDYFRDIDHITEAFRKFISLMPQNGLLIACTDDMRVKVLCDEYRGRAITYGMKNAEYYPANITYDENGYPSYTLMHGEDKVADVKLNVIGEYNILNSIAAAVCAYEMGADTQSIEKALQSFKPARRRFEYFGEKNGHLVYHDYAHHPGEIKAVLEGAKRFPHRKMYVVFQCNSYSRAKTLFCKNTDCFLPADVILVPDIYPGREKDDGTVHARDMVRSICESGANAIYIKDFEGINDYLDANAHEGDLVITLGSGDVLEQTRKLL